MVEPEKWKLLTIQHFGRCLNSKWSELMLDLLSVDCGLKPSLLFDYAVPDIKRISNFITDLQETGLLQCQNLKIVAADMDVLIVNSTFFTDATFRTKFENILFINVSAKLEQPQILSHNSCCLEVTQACFDQFLTDVDSKESKEIVLETKLADHVNFSTLFGIFLGYPVVYWYDTLDISFGNCLSMVPLLKFVVQGFHKTKGGHTTINSQLSHQDFANYGQPHAVFSFSIPDNFQLVLSQVNGWFDCLKQKGKWSPLFTDLRLESAVVQLPSVCL